MENIDNKNVTVDELIENEKRRNREERNALLNEIELLPKGSLYIRKVNGRQYCYFKYREGKKSITKYAGTIDKVQIMQESIDKRQKISERIKALDIEFERLKKMEEMK